MRHVIILGSTGSIGTQAIEVINKNPNKFKVVGLAAGSNSKELELQREHFDLNSAQAVLGADAATKLISETQADVVLNGITGSIGLAPTLAALRTGKTLALANKESLIVGGQLVKDLASPGQIVPVDSEHSAIAQCLRSGSSIEVKKLILTASGGPFRGFTKKQLSEVTPAQALAHPTWVMGQVVTTNSASMVNKGLEIIEAHLLFDIPFERIDVTVHPQSIIHSMVEFIDGSVIAQASPPDMKLPIALGLGWPDRIAGVSEPIDWQKSHSWQFNPLDEDVFTAVRLAREVGKLGKSYPAVYNASNEQAVAAFHRGLITFDQITELIERAVEAHEPDSELSLESVLAAEKWARNRTDAQIAKAC
jgi:1-deoxy-D-xylulose-5-phosphate reductoisomerase